MSSTPIKGNHVIEHPRVTSIICVYNMQKLIGRCIQSVLHQTLTQIELIIVDDGSVDKTGQICDSYADIDSRVKVIHQENQGLQAARRIGVQSAKGDYIHFLDADDWCEPGMYEKLYRDAIENDVGLVMCSAYRHRQDGVAIICNLPIKTGKYTIDSVRDIYVEPLFGDLKQDRLVTTGYIWCCLIKKDLTKSLQFYDDICMHEDEIMLLQILMKIQSIFINEEPLYHYNRMSSNSLSKRAGYWPGYWDNMIRVYNVKLSFAPFLIKSKSAYKVRLETYLCNKLLRSIRNETHYLNPVGFWGGLKNFRGFSMVYLIQTNRRFYSSKEFTYSDRVILFLARHKFYLFAYIISALSCGRMKKYVEKTKN